MEDDQMMPKTESEILDQIPDTWADDIGEAELNVRAEQIFQITIATLAEESGLSAIQPPEKILSSVLSGTGKDVGEAIAELHAVSVKTAKTVIFNERYGHMFPKDPNGELSMSSAMFAKITGDVAVDDNSEIPSGSLDEAAANSQKEQFTNAVRDAYFRWAKTPYPFFPWQKKKRKRAYLQATSEFVKTMIRFIWDFWKQNPDLTSHLANLNSFSELVTSLPMETFIFARPYKSSSGNKMIVDPFMAPKVLLIEENGAVLFALIEMLEATFAYRLEDNILRLRDSLRNGV
jgi:hypothetical protein